MSNSQLEEEQEKLFHEKLAAEFGITYDELLQLEWEIDTNGSDDGLIYEYIVTFNKESPRKILDKIQGIDNYVVRLQSSILETPEHFE